VDAGMASLHLADLGYGYEHLEEMRKAFPEADAARKEIEGIMARDGVWIGYSDKSLQLQSGEYASFGFTEDEAWISYDMGWKRPADELEAERKAWRAANPRK
jgi:hypothetical protein